MFKPFLKCLRGERQYEVLIIHYQSLVTEVIFCYQFLRSVRPPFPAELPGMPRATHILSSLIACALLLIDGIGAPDLYAQEPPEDASIAEKVATSEVEDKALTLAVTECKERLHVALETSRYAIEPVDASDIEVGPADISEASEAPEEADSSDSTDAEVSEEELLALEAALGEDAEQDAETVLDRAEQEIFSIAEDRVHAGFVPLSALVQDSFTTIEQLQAHKSSVGQKIILHSLASSTSTLPIFR